MTAPTTRETADMSKNPAETNTSAEHVKTSDHSKLQKMQIGPDHAELARLAEALRKPEIWQSYPGPEGDFEIRLAPFDAATGLEALLSEIAALREYGRDVAKEALEYRRQRDELRKAADTAANLFKICTEPTMFENVSTLNVYVQMTEWLVRNRPLLASQGVE